MADAWVDAYVRKTPRVQSSNKERGGLHLHYHPHHHPAHQTTSHLAIKQNEKKREKTATQTNPKRAEYITNLRINVTSTVVGST